MTVIILLLLPLLGGLITLFFKGGSAKTVALLFALAGFGLALIFLSQFVPDASSQFGVNYSWIERYGIHFKAGIDGISMVMVLLTTLLVPIIILSTFNHDHKNPPLFYALVLFMQAGL